MRRILVAITAVLCLSQAALAEEPAPQPKPEYHSASWYGGHGSSWRIGNRTYGFQGTLWGCHYAGHAGPHGYHLDKVC
jgi:hypothetical protein